jgi:hypothetical protein
LTIEFSGATLGFGGATLGFLLGSAKQIVDVLEGDWLRHGDGG